MKKGLLMAPLRLRKTLLIAFPFLCLGMVFFIEHSLAQLSGRYPAAQERDFYEDNGPGGNEGGSILDATNPLELMNRLRRASAMDDATSPSDAIDQALESLEFEDLKSIPPNLAEPK